MPLLTPWCSVWITEGTANVYRTHHAELLFNYTASLRVLNVSQSPNILFEGDTGAAYLLQELSRVHRSCDYAFATYHLPLKTQAYCGYVEARSSSWKYSTNWDKVRLTD